MKRTIQFLIASSTVISITLFAHAAPSTRDPQDLQQLAMSALSPDLTQSSQAIARLRAAGPAGLQALFDTHADTLALPHTDPKWQRLSGVLDAVGKQRDCYASQLYWYTDFEQAKAAAKSSGKPILSLRLLGNLDEEFSCANSRFFRTALYANTEVSQYLRDHFVLHWKSVRPVPKVTIDFGDGRRLERTLTGNSIHYVLDADGRPIDALPGLYGPKAFLMGLQKAENAIVASPDLRQWHRTQLDALAAGLRDAGVKTPPDDRALSRLAKLQEEDARLDAGSKALIRAKNPDAFDAARLTFSKKIVEDPLLRAVRTFERSMAEDTVRNEYLLHAKIHEWFATYPEPNVEVLNDRVYAELFLTPSSDPWLGLVLADGYTALEDNGIVAAKSSRP